MSDFPEFDGKCLLIYSTNNVASHSVLVENARFETQAGRLFIVGNGANIGGHANWTRGIPVCIAWDQIESYYVFDSAEQHRQRQEQWRESVEENKYK
jgi:hypothetical protein